tara:strand:- start:6713 stop:7081 length:369 start_codon:yes stop_codon:yes gene_type:complete
MLTTQEINALGQICQTSWGKSSDEMRLTSSLAGDSLQLTMQQIVHFGREKSLELQSRHLNEVSNDIFTDAIKKIKGQFKDIAGRTLKCEEVSRDWDLEMVQATSNSPRRIAYYRALINLKVS